MSDLVHVFAVKVGDKYVTRTDAALTRNKPKLWIKAADAENTAASRGYKNFKVVEFRLVPVDVVR